LLSGYLLPVLSYHTHFCVLLFRYFLPVVIGLLFACRYPAISVIISLLFASCYMVTFCLLLSRHFLPGYFYSATLSLLFLATFCLLFRIFLPVVISRLLA
jgi:hypothetical protein